MITITSCKYYDEFLGTGGGNQGSDYLLGSVGSKVTAVINFRVKVSSENITLITSATNSTLTRTDGGSFVTDGFQSGNSISVVGIGSDSGNHAVTFVTDKVITLSSTLTTSSTYFNGSIYRTNLLTASEYYYNLVENSAPDSFLSLVDTETQQRYVASGFTATGTTGTYTIASNSKGWAVDGDGYGVSIEGLGISNYTQSFRITQVFIITPIALYSQANNLESGIPPAPDYYQDRKCLRHVFKINMKINRTDSEVVDSVTYSKKGNTAWFGEFLNGEPATYRASDLVYSYDGDSVDEIQYDDTKVTNVVFSVLSDNSKITNSTVITAHIAYIPSDQSDYTNTVNKFRDCFAYDRATQTPFTPPVAGINSGTTYQQILSLYTERIDDTKLSVNMEVRMATELMDRIAGKSEDDRKYLLFVTIQDPTVTQTKNTDMNSIIVDFNSYGKDLDDSSLVQVASITYKNATGGVIGSYVNGFGGDIVYADVLFRVKNSGRQKLYSVGVRTDAQGTGSTETFNLEEWNADTSGVCLDDGIQEISITEPKGYRLPDNHILNNVTVSRYPSIDSATRAGYRLIYPFQLRYETWRPLENSDCDFGNATQDWSVISNKLHWGIKQYVTFSAYDPATDHITESEQVSDINVKQIGATGDTGTWGVVTTYDNAGINKQWGDVLNYENTTVVADFYGDFSSLPTGTTGYYAMLFLDQQTIGGVNWVHPFASHEDVRVADGNSPWIGATGDTGTCSITIVSPTHIQVRAKLDYTKLSPAINNYNYRSKLDYLR